MNFYFSYKVLEKRINEIKSDVDSLWSVVDQLSDTEEVKNQKQNEEVISLADSYSSYHTAICVSDTSLDTFVTAIEYLDENVLEEVCDIKTLSISTNETSKKTVSFSGQITILEVSNKYDKRKKAKEKISNIKNKFIDYLYREKFYLKYKWHKLRSNIKPSSKRNENQITSGKSSENGIVEEIKDKENKTNVINLQIFFNKSNSNFILETDIDQNFHLLHYQNYPFQRTDITTPTVLQKLTSEIEENVSNKKVIKETETKMKVYKTNMIEPKYLDKYTEVPEVKSFSCDLLYKYLVSKAQYPIQLKIANSIVKLNLPIWYQASLIV